MEPPVFAPLDAVLFYGIVLTYDAFLPWDPERPPEDVPACHAYLAEPIEMEEFPPLRVLQVGNDRIPRYAVAVESSLQISPRDHARALPFQGSERSKVSLAALPVWTEALRSYVKEYKLEPYIDTLCHEDKVPRWILCTTPGR